MAQQARCLTRFVTDSPRVFASVTKLSLRNLRLSSADVAVLLGACTRLEHLVLYNCHDGRRSLVIDGAGAAPELRELEMKSCDYARLTCDAWSAEHVAPLSLRHGPCLRELILHSSAAPCRRRRQGS
ncbi:hypothetical protein E2562_005926 [Oryza meyeriana var. granulata]|uniref:Uncharacterized protein n=1 Tax=Oryza meyeriana var. granulata TaxID=110450 RepID=A0A6G1DV33_9ORYZ|nr:hypothetical protein E2562_005926 [Oryza meyeriana var. granulata]